jgi:hypothetical protein
MTANTTAVSPRLRRACLTALLMLVVAGVVAGFASGSNVQTVHIVTDKGSITTLDFPPKGESPGDINVVSANVMSADGRRVIGRVRGTQTEIKVDHGTETVQGMLTIELGAGNEIIIGGLGAYPLTAPAGLVKRKSFVRAVLGGTGKYAGARGTDTSRQLAGGGYDHVFRLTY